MKPRIPRLFLPLCPLLLLLGAPPAGSHPGGLDASGCHRQRQSGGYHCHRALPEADEASLVKKSRTGICHPRSSPNYHQLRHYQTFHSLQACLDSGGRTRRT
jgi:hypothetical protein